MKRCFHLILLVACALILMTSLPGAAWAELPPYGPPGGASGPPLEGCPPAGGWVLVRSSGPGHLSWAYDFNSDEHVCAKFLPQGGFTLMDNVVRGG